MGWKPKNEDECEDVPVRAPKGTQAPAPGKTTKTLSFRAPKQSPPPERGAAAGDLLPRPGDDPFALHLLGPEDGVLAPGPGQQPRAATLDPSDAYVADEVARDFAYLKPAGIDVATPEDYVARAKKRFVTLERYIEWRGEANELLEQPLPGGGTVRRLINERGETQRVLFYWVSWEYHRRGFDTAAIVKLFGAGLTPEMRTALAGAEAELGAKIPIQSFCPRPQRDGDRYLMGTFSEHSLGRAVDIEPDFNPILVGPTWKALEGAVGRPVDRSADRWEWMPEALYDDLASFSDQWAMTVDAALHTERDRMKAGAARLNARPPVEIDESTLRIHVIRELLRCDEKTARKLAALPGLRFLDHPRERVLALRQQGLVWGATFPNVDLHHFELASRPLTPFASLAPLPPRRGPTRTDRGGPANDDTW